MDSSTTSPPISPPILRLPQELINEIIDIALSKYRTNMEPWMASCALVCPAFRGQCQAHLFSFISFSSGCRAADSETISQRYNAFYQLLKQNPSIANYVRGVALEITDNNAWITNDPIFTAIMDKITSNGKLRGLSLKGKHCGEITDTHGFIERFSQPFIAPHINRLKLYNVQKLPIELLKGCVNVTDMFIEKITLKDPPPETKYSQTVQNESRPRLQKLRHESCGQALQMMVKPGQNGSPSFVDFSRLRCFGTVLSPKNSGIDLDGDEEGTIDADHEAEQQIIDAAWESLDNLAVIFSKDCLSEPPKSHVAFNLAKSVNLRRLATSVTFRNDDVDRKYNLSQICRTLTTVQQSKHFEALYLTVYVGFFGPPVGPEAVLDADWDKLFAELARIVSLGANNRFKISLNLVYQIRTQERQTEERRQERVSRCQDVLNQLSLQHIGRSIKFAYFPQFSRP